MKPTIIIHILEREIALKSYSLFMIIGATMVLIVSLWNMKKAGLSIKSSLIYLFIMIWGVLIGARVLNVLINWDYYMNNKWKIYTLNFSGFSLMGGLIFAGILGILLAKLLKLSYWELGDAIAPGLGLGLIFMRIGCFFNGCCFGLKTRLPWGIKFPYDSFAHRFYLQEELNNGAFSIFKLSVSPSIHPTQIYEIIGAIIATIVSIIIIRKKKSSGTAIIGFSIVFTITRFINHFFRVQPSTNMIPYFFYPALYSIIILILIVLLYRISHLKQKAS